MSSKYNFRKKGGAGCGPCPAPCVPAHFFDKGHGHRVLETAEWIEGFLIFGKVLAEGLLSVTRPSLQFPSAAAAEEALLDGYRAKEDQEKSEDDSKDFKQEHVDSFFVSPWAVASERRPLADGNPGAGFEFVRGDPVFSAALPGRLKCLPAAFNILPWTGCQCKNVRHSR